MNSIISRLASLSLATTFVLALTACGTQSTSNESAAVHSVRDPDAVHLPQKLTCSYVRDGKKVRDVIYTRLEKVSKKSQLTETGLSVWGETGDKPKADEVAIGWKDDYFAASIDAKQFSYNLWTCDTEDRAYTFQTADLLKISEGGKGSVKGKLNISIREDEENYDLNCSASF